MTTDDWHSHAEDIDPTPTLSLLPPLTDLVVTDDAPAAGPQADTAEALLAAQVADELAVLTRVLLGLGLPDPEPRVVVEPVVPLQAFADDDGVFVAPPIVEIEPLVALVPQVDMQMELVPELEPEPVKAPVRDAQAILDELAFLDR